MGVGVQNCLYETGKGDGWVPKHHLKKKRKEKLRKGKNTHAITSKVNSKKTEKQTNKTKTPPKTQKPKYKIWKVHILAFI